MVDPPWVSGGNGNQTKGKIEVVKEGSPQTHDERRKYQEKADAGKAPTLTAPRKESW